jgi:flagellar motor protein MotB
MADDLSQRPIVIKRIKKVAGGHHGGAWKIAYADFVTAMMAFFLLMWLLGSSTKSQLGGHLGIFQNTAQGRHDRRIVDRRNQQHTQRWRHRSDPAARRSEKR